MTSDGERTYEWDVWSRLTKITWATGKTTIFHYNALGERTKIVHVDGAATRTEYYLYDGPRPIQRRSEATVTSNIDREYLSGGERRWNTGTGAWVNHHFTRDHLGSVREVLDSSGTLLARYDYALYGERTTRYEASGYSSDVGFTGHFHLPSPASGQSEILLAHYRAYDPVPGRWLSQDPIREFGGVNLYGYVGGNVAWAIDPWGLETWDEWLVGALPGWAVDALGSSPEIPRGVQDFTAGLADSLSFGVSKEIREAMGTNNMVDPCSGSYLGGELVAIGAGLGRTSYAGAAKLASRYHRVAGTLDSARKAVATRNRLKAAFRLNPFSKYRMHSFEQIAAKYGWDPLRIIEAAGRTDTALNMFGAGALIGGLLNELSRQSDCP
jgi:RHS repeat-associated protein